jgi:hypothetical protein
MQETAVFVTLSWARGSFDHGTIVACVEKACAENAHHMQWN